MVTDFPFSLQKKKKKKKKKKKLKPRKDNGISFSLYKERFMLQCLDGEYALNYFIWPKEEKM